MFTKFKKEVKMGQDLISPGPFHASNLLLFYCALILVQGQHFSPAPTQRAV